MIRNIVVPENPMEQSAPNFLYYRFKFAAGETTKYINYQIDYGYYYNLKNLVAKMPYKNSAGNNLFCFAKIDVRNTDRNRIKNNEPIPLVLIASPGNNSVVSAAPTPFDATGFNVNMTAEPLQNTLLINDTYLYRSSIFTIVTIDRVLAFDTYLDILIRGYNVPENYKYNTGSN